MSVYTPLSDGTIRLLSPFKALYHVFQPGLHLTAPVCISTYVPPPNKTVNFSAQRSTDQFSRNFFTFKRTDGVPSSTDSIVNEGLALCMYRPAIVLLPSYSLDITVTNPGTLRIYKLERELEVAIDLCDNLTVYCVHTGSYSFKVPFLGTFYIYSEDAEITSLRATAIVPELYQLTISPVVTLTTCSKKYEVAWTVKIMLGRVHTGCYRYEPTPDWEVVANAIKKTFTHYQIPVPLTPIMPNLEEVKPILLIIKYELKIGVLGTDCALSGGTLRYAYVSHDTRQNVQGLFSTEDNDIEEDILVSDLRIFLSELSSKCNLPEGTMLGALIKEGDKSYSYNTSIGSTPNTKTAFKLFHYGATNGRIQGTVTLLKRSKYGLVPYINDDDEPASWEMDYDTEANDVIEGDLKCSINDCVWLWSSTEAVSGDTWSCEYTYYNQGNVQGK